MVCPVFKLPDCVVGFDSCGAGADSLTGCFGVTTGAGRSEGDFETIGRCDPTDGSGVVLAGAVVPVCADVTPLEASGDFRFRLRLRFVGSDDV